MYRSARLLSQSVQRPSGSGLALRATRIKSVGPAMLIPLYLYLSSLLIGLIDIYMKATKVDG